MFKKTRRRVRRNKNTAALKFLIALLVVALCGVGVMAVYAFNNYQNHNKMMQATVSTDKIYENIFINDVPVGGLSKEAAALMLKKEFIPGLQDNTVTVVSGEHSLELSFGEFGARYDFSEAVEEAYAYGKEGSLKDRYDMVIALRDTPHKITSAPNYTYERGNISAKLEPLRDAVNIEPLNASISRKDGQFILSNSQTGRVLNTDATVKLMEGVLDSGKSGVVTAAIDEILPEHQTEDFSDVQSLIGSYTTKMTGGTVGRNTNIETALSKINDVVIYPGEVFSTNKHFGVMSYENGYRPAPVIIGGKLSDDMGGGVCQVSSTLYNAVLLAELEIVERRNHSLKVGYVPSGFDATLAGDYIDFKFKNDTDAPVFVEAILDGSNVIVNLYGREVHSPNRSIVFDSELVETVSPMEALETEDASLPLGERVEVVKASNGSRYRVYKTIYENGVVQERVLINTSYYKPTRAEFLVGTGVGVTGHAAIEPLPLFDADPAPIQPDDSDLYETSDDTPTVETPAPTETPAPAETPAEITPPVEITPPEDSAPTIQDPPPTIDEPEVVE